MRSLQILVVMQWKVKLFLKFLSFARSEFLALSLSSSLPLFLSSSLPLSLFPYLFVSYIYFDTNMYICIVYLHFFIGAEVDEKNEKNKRVHGIYLDPEYEGMLLMDEEAYYMLTVSKKCKVLSPLSPLSILSLTAYPSQFLSLSPLTLGVSQRC